MLNSSPSESAVKCLEEVGVIFLSLQLREVGKKLIKKNKRYDL